MVLVQLADLERRGLTTCKTNATSWEQFNHGSIAED